MTNKKKTRRLTEPGKEHLEVDDKGNIVGLYALDVDKLDGVDSWEAVDQVIKEYTLLHPKDMELLVWENAQIRNNNYNRFGSGETGAMRHGVAIPPGLLFKLERVMPDLFQNRKKLHHFMKKYKGFRTCDIV